MGGFIGAFFALPTAAAIQAFITTYATRYEVEDTEPTTVDDEMGRAARSCPASQGGARRMR